MPHGVHAAGVVVNHFVELVVPFGLFLPQPIASVAAVIIILFQSALIVSGNLSWLNWLTIVLCLPVVADRWLSWMPVRPAASLEAPAFRLTSYGVAAIVAALSIAPTINLLSPRQSMNASFEPLHLVNTYGAFGTITRERFEIVLEGTDADTPGETAQWREYEVRGKPGDPARLPPQVAPYHLRLGWLMWFEAMSPAPSSRWFINLVAALLRGDRETLGLFARNPFPDRPRASCVRSTTATSSRRPRNIDRAATGGRDNSQALSSDLCRSVNSNVGAGLQTRPRPSGLKTRRHVDLEMVSATDLYDHP
jgi:hypothetical protein